MIRLLAAAAAGITATRALRAARAQADYWRLQCFTARAQADTRNADLADANFRLDAANARFQDSYAELTAAVDARGAEITELRDQLEHATTRAGWVRALADGRGEEITRLTRLLDELRAHVAAGQAVQTRAAAWLTGLDDGPLPAQLADLTAEELGAAALVLGRLLGDPQAAAEDEAA